MALRQLFRAGRWGETSHCTSERFKMISVLLGSVRPSHLPPDAVRAAPLRWDPWWVLSRKTPEIAILAS